MGSVIIHIKVDHMIRTQVSLEKNDCDLAKKQAVGCRVCSARCPGQAPGSRRSTVDEVRAICRNWRSAVQPIDRRSSVWLEGLSIGVANGVITRKQGSKRTLARPPSSCSSTGLTAIIQYSTSHSPHLRFLLVQRWLWGRPRLG
jgi:hypothetical protein